MIGVVRNEATSNVKQVKVAWIALPGEGGFKAKPLEKSKARDFVARMQAQAASIKGVTRVVPIAGNGHPNAPGNDSGAPMREPGDEF